MGVVDLIGEDADVGRPDLQLDGIVAHERECVVVDPHPIVERAGEARGLGDRQHFTIGRLQSKPVIGADHPVASEDNGAGNVDAAEQGAIVMLKGSVMARAPRDRLPHCANTSER